MKIKKGDAVRIIAGKERGKTGTVTRVLRNFDKVVVDGINIVKRHQKSRRRGSQGQIVEKSLPVHVSNVALVAGGKPVRVGYAFEGEGEKRAKVRVARPSGKKI
jgi:large subunit ribosomal protein L24